MDLSAFYGAFSPACFALLGLWLVAVQVRLSVWEKDPERRRRSYGVALHFALPGMMSVFALIDVQDSIFWRVSFAVVALSGAVIMVTVRGFPVPREDGQAGQDGFPPPTGSAWPPTRRRSSFISSSGCWPCGRASALRTEAVLQTLLVFLGFNVAWLLLLDDSKPSPASPLAKTE